MIDIIDTAIGAKNFTTLVAALKAANLVQTLKGAGPFTVFAPTVAKSKKSNYTDTVSIYFIYIILNA